jgi:hypothetical protein
VIETRGPAPEFAAAAARLGITWLGEEARGDLDLDEAEREALGSIQDTFI